ncbi:hypothetical protein DRN85_09885 [Methanosarcinales archaeon]|nr:MAG: hypothetical protein DRN85_09885 [Methanosarcinales archaeon]
MSMTLTTLAIQAAGGFVTGALIGYALRRAIKVFLSILGIWLLSIVSLGTIGIITINWAELNELVSNIIAWLGIESGNIASFISTAGVFGLTLTVGFFAGAGFLHSVENIKKFKFVKRKK